MGCYTIFLFSQNHKNLVSTYNASYCLSYSVKKTIQEQVPLQLWKENKFLMQVNATGG